MSENNKEIEVKHPSHYNKGGIEVWDIIKAYDLNFDCGNAVKYILRAKYKGNYLKDLEKAIEYLNHEIEFKERENESKRN